MTLKTKAQFREAFMAGLLGNRLKTWRSYHELVDSGHTGTVSMRVVTPDSQYTKYRLVIKEIPQYLEDIRKADPKADLTQIWYNESAPDEQLVLQGELLDRSLTYSVARTTMKDAMRAPCYAEGSATELILQTVMNGNSHDDLQLLRRQFPDHAIEFSVYDHCLGNLPLRNTIIWEVRQY